MYKVILKAFKLIFASEAIIIIYYDYYYYYFK